MTTHAPRPFAPFGVRGRGVVIPADAPAPGEAPMVGSGS